MPTCRFCCFPETVNGPFANTYRRYTAQPPGPTTTTREPLYPTPPKRVPVGIKQEISYVENAKSFGISSSSGGRWLVRLRPEPSKGTVWPHPQQFYSDQHIAYQIDPSNFKFIPRGVHCELLSKAILRIRRILFGHITNRSGFSPPASPPISDDVTNEDYDNKRKPGEPEEEDLNARTFTSVIINHINITLVKPCKKYPSLESDESCK